MIDDVNIQPGPDLGAYLQPDPEHMTSAKSFSGRQAYAYASGRPLVNVDPDGRLVRVSGPWSGAWSWAFHNVVVQRLFLVENVISEEQVGEA